MPRPRPWPRPGRVPVLAQPQCPTAPRPHGPTAPPVREIFKLTPMCALQILNECRHRWCSVHVLWKYSSNTWPPPIQPPRDWTHRAKCFWVTLTCLSVTFWLCFRRHCSWTPQKAHKLKQKHWNLEGLYACNSCILNGNCQSCQLSWDPSMSNYAHCIKWWTLTLYMGRIGPVRRFRNCR